MSKTRLSRNYRCLSDEQNAAYMKRLLAHQNRIRAEEKALVAVKKDPRKVKSGDADKILEKEHNE